MSFHVHSGEGSIAPPAQGLTCGSRGLPSIARMKRGLAALRVLKRVHRGRDSIKITGGVAEISSYTRMSFAGHIEVLESVMYRPSVGLQNALSFDPLGWVVWRLWCSRRSSIERPFVE